MVVVVVVKVSVVVVVAAAPPGRPRGAVSGEPEGARVAALAADWLVDGGVAQVAGRLHADAEPYAQIVLKYEFPNFEMVSIIVN